MAQVPAPLLQQGVLPAQVPSNNWVKGYIDANGGCFAWRNLLRSADWTRGAPFGKLNTEWTEGDFRLLEQASTVCIYETNRNRDIAESIRRDIQADLDQRRQHLTQIVEQDQRRRAAEAAAQARQQESLRLVEQNRAQVAARAEQQRQQALEQQAQRQQSEANAFVRRQAQQAEQEERQAALAADYAQKVASARARYLPQIQATRLPQEYLVAPIVLDMSLSDGTYGSSTELEFARRLQDSLAAGAGGTNTDIYNRITLQDAIALVLASGEFEQVSPCGGTLPTSDQVFYGFSVKKPNQRSQVFAFVLDGTELYLKLYGTGDTVRAIAESDRFNAVRTLKSMLRQAAENQRG